MRKFVLFLLVLAISLGAQAKLVALPGTTPQSALINTYFPNLIRIQVLDESDQPRPGAAVRMAFWAINPFTDYDSFRSQCSPDAGWNCVVTADAAGILTFGPVSGGTAGTASIFFGDDIGRSVSDPRNSYLNVFLTVLPGGPPLQVSALGDGQVIALGGDSAQPIGAKVTRSGAPQAGLTVSFSVNPGGALVQFPSSTLPGGTSTSAVTDENGVAMASQMHGINGLGAGTVIISVRDVLFGLNTTTSLGFTQTRPVGSKVLDVQNLWWGGPTQSGWGLSITQHEDRLFGVVFAYDPAGKPFWMVAEGGAWGGALGNAYGTGLRIMKGSPYYAYDTTKFTTTNLGGSASLEFSNERNAMLSFRLGGDSNLVTPRAIAPLDFAPASTQPELGITDMWWGGESQAGWGLSLTEQKGNVFGAWFTYDANGDATWFELPDGHWVDSLTWVGNVYRTSSSGWYLHVFDTTSVRETFVGTATVRFSDKSHALFSWDVEGHKGSTPIQRYAF